MEEIELWLENIKNEKEAYERLCSKFQLTDFEKIERENLADSIIFTQSMIIDKLLNR